MNRNTIVLISLISILSFGCQNIIIDNQDFEFIGWISETKEISNVSEFSGLSNQDLNQVDGEYLALGYSDDSFWIKIKLNENYKGQKEIDLAFNNPMLNNILVFDNIGNHIISTGRMHVDRNNYESFFNIISLPENEDLTYFLKIKSFGNVNIPLELVKKDSFIFSINERNLFFGIYFGIVFAMFFYNLFLFFFNKR